jgi:hypothetical protein
MALAQDQTRLWKQLGMEKPEDFKEIKKDGGDERRNRDGMDIPYGEDREVLILERMGTKSPSTSL